MNPNLASLQLYPFQRLAQLKQGLVGNPKHEHVALSIGEPKHPAPDFIVNALATEAAIKASLGTYPTTLGSTALRSSIANWLARRFNTKVDPATQVLPVAGTREALFSFGQAVLSGKPDALAVVPNPFYQIYEGAALLRGAQLCFANCTAATGYQPDFDSITDKQWQHAELVYLCSPGNPTGRTLPMDQLQALIKLAERWNFIIAADECYSEIYPDETNPPIGLLEACTAMGNPTFERCVVFHSLSKRSNLPGLRSGFVAGDANILADYFAYRTYEGCALPALTQHVSSLAWDDETHVIANRAAYREKFSAVLPILQRGFDIPVSDGGFYCWLPLAGDDQAFAAKLFEREHITVLPGSFLGRNSAISSSGSTINKSNPGTNHIRVAWVAPLDQCIDAAERLLDSV